MRAKASDPDEASLSAYEIRHTADAGFIDSLGRIAAETNLKVLGLREETPPEEIAALLEIPQGTKSLHATRLRSAGRVPLLLTDSWIPLDIGKHVTLEKLRELPLYESLMQHGIPYGRVIQEITAILADPNVAKYCLAK